MKIIIQSMFLLAALVLSEATSAGGLRATPAEVEDNKAPERTLQVNPELDVHFLENPNDGSGPPNSGDPDPSTGLPATNREDGEECDTRWQCKEGSTCWNGMRCRPAVPLGGVCENGTHCQSGFCPVGLYAVRFCQTFRPQKFGVL